MNLKIIFLSLIFFTNIFASNFNANKLTKEDINKLKVIKELGQKHGLSYSLMAIAIKESSLGRYQINVDSKDYGLFQANIKTVLSRHNVKNTSWNRNRYAMRLVSDMQFATKNAIAELTYWKKVHKNDWRKVWSSYNGGWKYNSKRAQKYSRDIAKIIRELKKVKV
ncbi:hypothetical protein GCM10012288_08760 [Malaciobacter pacificus]|jgi:hypothetical protein|uniref:Uncharacterized protein n=1 Tax=Malaciobacter pacificus TaxID=1080223 RepID=A0A5C2H8D1_9BACT|nr:transglycosylase SLT domain-containing protein [Malaciobacter pacificus]QEP35073.1 hypothetical protein APAC_2001 [Malaciobacter pacificus]GGD36906.1 hypothetical protein GCM10012288_08760 [Malaciobacter pacificus]